MPIVELHLIEGYDAETKQKLGSALTDAVRLVVPAAPELVTVLIHELPNHDYYRGGERRSPAPARCDAASLVRGFLAAMEARDLDGARAMLGEGFEMRFPGTGPMRELTELLDWAAPRYRFVKKAYDGVDAMQGGGEATIVYCRGTLSGEWPDGTPFAGIRFIDRFEVAGDRIVKQDVWNDMAEQRP